MLTSGEHCLKQSLGLLTRLPGAVPTNQRIPAAGLQMQLGIYENFRPFTPGLGLASRTGLATRRDGNVQAIYIQLDVRSVRGISSRAGFEGTSRRSACWILKRVCLLVHKMVATDSDPMDVIAAAAGGQLSKGDQLMNWQTTTEVAAARGDRVCCAPNIRVRGNLAVFIR